MTTEVLNDTANDVLARMHCPECPATDDPCLACAALIGKVIESARASERAQVAALAERIDEQTRFTGEELERARAAEAALRDYQSQVAALVEAARQPHTLRICSAVDWHGETRFDCAEYGTWSAFDGESWDWQCERHANERPDWWNDDEDGEWGTAYEPDDGVIALVAALASLSRD